MSLERNLICLLGTALGASAAADDRAWSPRDSIEMTQFVSPEMAYGEQPVIGAQPIVSPDGKRFFVTTMRGDLESDCTIYQILVYKAQDIERAFVQRSATPPQPEQVSTIKSKSTRDPGLFATQWSADSRRLIYLAQIDKEPRQVVRWDLSSDTTTPLTNSRHGVETFTISGDTLIYNAMVEHTEADEETLFPYPATYMRPQQWWTALGGHSTQYAMFVRIGSGSERQIGKTRNGGMDAWDAILQQAYISPDGATAIIPRPIPRDEVPAAWHAYRDASGDPHERFRQFVIVNLATLKERAAIDAPIGDVVGNHLTPVARWSADSKRVVLVNTLLPMRPDAKERVSTAYTVEYRLKDGHWRILKALDKDEKDVAGEQAYKLRDGLSVRIRQTMNEPPRLVAAKGTRELQLSPPDPALATLRRHRIELMTWKDATGRGWRGLRVLPSSAPPDGGYPLVIQISDINPDYFLPDGGSYRPGFAAQSFAARGFAVLTLNPIKGAAVGTPDEGPGVIAGIESAVAELGRHHRIDKNRIGLMGFSRTGYHTLYAITKLKAFKPAAAIVQDSWDGSYATYLLGGTLPDGQLWQYEKQFAGGAFWDNKDAWLAEAPGFNLELADTPLLIANHYAPFVGGLITLMEPYAAMRRYGRPVEVKLYRDGFHVFLRPAHRLSAMQGALDWTSFWLRGDEDDDETKADQYAYWRKMKTEWEATKRAAHH